MASSISNKSVRFISHRALQESEQWKVTLQDIKLLYIQRQYKRCVARSSAILNAAREPIHPVYKTYLYFYSAVSYEAMGQYTHNYSINKLPLLHSALDCFVTCLAVFPATIPGSEPQTPSYTSLGAPSTSDISETLSPTDSLVSSITDIIDRSFDYTQDDPFLSEDDVDDVKRGFDIKGTIPLVSQSETDKQSLMPSPLHVRKPSAPLHLSRGSIHSADESAKTIYHTSRPDRARAPPPLPIKVMPFETSNHYSSKSKLSATRKWVGVCSSRSSSSSHQFDPYNTEPQARSSPSACATAIENYNSSIEFLHTEINSSIYRIHRLIDEVTELRRARKTSKSFQRSASFWSFSPVKEGSSQGRGLYQEQTSSKETMEERIIRLRDEEWKTVGLKSSKRGWKGEAYYQAFCGSVLDELYLNA